LKPRPIIIFFNSL